MEMIYDVQTRGCLVWETEHPLTDISRKSSNFWLLGYEWNFHLSCTAASQQYQIILRKVDDRLPLETDLNVTTCFPLDAPYYRCMKHKCRDAEQVVWWFDIKQAKQYSRHEQKWTVIFIFDSDQPLRLHLPMSETELLSSLSDTDPQLSSAPDAKNLSKAVLAEDKCVQVCSDIPPDMESLSSDFRQLLEREIFPDVKLRCGDRTMSAHRSILAARSNVFTTMFRNKMADSVDVTDVDSEVLDLLLQYVYSGKIPDLSDDTASRLYEASVKYCIPALKTACSDWMVRNLTAENCLGYLVVADAHSDEDFKDRVVDFAAGNLKSMKKDAWCKFNEDHAGLAISVYQKHLASTLAEQV